MPRRGQRRGTSAPRPSRDAKVNTELLTFLFRRQVVLGGAGTLTAGLPCRYTNTSSPRLAEPSCSCDPCSRGGGSISLWCPSRRMTRQPRTRSSLRSVSCNQKAKDMYQRGVSVYHILTTTHYTETATTQSSIIYLGQIK